MAAVGMPFPRRDHAVRKAGDETVFSGGGVEDAGPRHPGFIGDEADRLPILRDVESLHLPGDVGSHHLDATAGGRPLHEPGELRLLVGRRPDRPAVWREGAAAPGDVLGPVLVEPRLRPAGDVDEPASALVDGERFADQELRAVGRPIENAPPAAGILDDEPVGGGIAGIDHPQVAVGAVAARRGIGDPVAGPVPHPAAILRAATVGEERDVAGGDIEPVHLAELIPPSVAGEEEELSLLRIPVGGPDRLGEEGELAAGPAGHPHLVDLRRIPEAGADEHLHACWMPADEGCTPRLGIAAHLVGQARRDLRDPLDDEIFRGADRGRRGCLLRSDRRSGRCNGDEEEQLGGSREAGHARAPCGGGTQNCRTVLRRLKSPSGERPRRPRLEGSSRGVAQARGGR